MDKTGFLATLGKDFLDPSLFAEAFCGPDELDLKSGRFSNTLCILANLISKGLGELRIVEYSDIAGTQMRGHSIRVTDARNGPSDDNTVKAG